MPGGETEEQLREPSTSAVVLPRRTRRVRRHKGETRAVTIEKRAKRAVEIWERDMALRPGQVKKLIQDEFGCGIVAAEVAWAKAREYLAEVRLDPGIADRIAASYLRLASKAEHAGDLNTARRALDSLARLFGLGQENVNITGTVDVVHSQLDDMTDEELHVLSRVDRPKLLSVG